MDEQPKIVYWWTADSDNNCILVESNVNRFPVACYNYLVGDLQTAIDLAQEKIRELELLDNKHI